MMVLTHIRIPIALAKMKFNRTELLILSLAASFNGNYLRLSNAELAENLGVTRRNVVKAVSNLKQSGYLENHSNGSLKRKLKVTEKVREVVNQTTRGGEPNDTTEVGNQTTPDRELNDPKIGNQTTPIKNKKKFKRKYTSESTEFRLAELLLSQIRKIKPDVKKPDLQKWSMHIDRMLRIDKRSKERIEAVIQSYQTDKFWQDKILSPESLRKHFDRLEMRLSKSKKPYQVERGPDGLTNYERAMKQINERKHKT